MFEGKRFVTTGVLNLVPPSIQLLLWSLIDTMKGPKDYLQIFELKSKGRGQKIVHRQEYPMSFTEYMFDNAQITISTKVYVIDDGDYCTMLLPEER